MTRFLSLCALCALLAACGVKRPLHLEGHKKGEKPPVSLPTNSTPAASPMSDADRMLNAMHPPTDDQ